MSKEGGSDNKTNRERLGTSQESCNMEIEREPEGIEEFIAFLDKTLPDVTDEEDAFREDEQQEGNNKVMNRKQSEPSENKEDVEEME